MTECCSTHGDSFCKSTKKNSVSGNCPYHHDQRYTILMTDIMCFQNGNPFHIDTADCLRRLHCIQPPRNFKSYIFHTCLTSCDTCADWALGIGTSAIFEITASQSLARSSPMGMHCGYLHRSSEALTSTLMLPWTFFIKKCVMPFLTASSMARTTK